MPLIPNQTESGSQVFRAVLRGAAGFAIVSLAGFSVWAFGGKWLYMNTGEVGLYSACLVTFLGLSGVLLHPLVRDPRPLLQFYRIFTPAFFAYAILWCAAWFAWRFGTGEWVGSLVGCVAFAAVTGWGFGNYHGFVKVCIGVFCCHSAGYFLGGKLMHWMAGPGAAAMLTGFSKAQLSLAAKLSWGLLYGLGFGAGIGYAFCVFQFRVNPAATARDGV